MGDDANITYTLETIPERKGSEKLYAVIGDPVAHSLSPQMHNAAFRALELNSRYVKIRLTPEELRAGIEQLRLKGYSGWNVTVPHKVGMFGLVESERLSPEVRLVHAVNTVLHDNGLFEGFSTDGRGWWAAVEETLLPNPGHHRILIVGAGGSGQSLALFIAYFCTVQNTTARLTLTNRSANKAHAIADLIAQRHPGTSCAVAKTSEEISHAISEADLIINTTSLGLKPDDEIPIKLPDDLSGKYVYDLIYNPAETTFLRTAKAAGAKTANGLSMLLWQGAYAFRIWHPGLSEEQKAISLAAMRCALEDATGQKLPERPAS